MARRSSGSFLTAAIDAMMSHRLECFRVENTKMGMDQTAVSQPNSLPVMSTQEKALAINLDAGKFGTFAEIGAGQEAARWFFHVGHASATVAKSMSAYDMVISDIVYGPTDHYVSRARLESMLDHEWEQLIERLDPVRGERSGFFVFADTVAMRSRSRNQTGQGWMGMRFQAQPRAPAQGALFSNHHPRQPAGPGHGKRARGVGNPGRQPHL
jgi:hypothetical protein